ncbi:MAG: DNA mismatch repair endonuclease MutL [Candidatus Adiutrix sp.]|jgi:DNA mismatch repair protein MutL|nr:DNA mismatch repair endonuclease MutL [Candidatus Adiutrix sp.]
MARIKLLPDSLINRIAAGEVVERPSSVLKELLENSLDSGATRIDVEVLSGGKKLIRVRDNGRGMNEDDLFLCIERHATSKIDKDADLVHIHTLGFRGEALPSIGAVSRLTITSAEQDGEGHMLRVNGGRLEKIEGAPANPGTTVEVADLFYNVPARRKFLKSDHTESAHLLDITQRYALSREGLRLTYREGGRELLSVDAQSDFRTRVFRILGREAAEKLAPFAETSDSLKISGWLGSPETALRGSSGLFLYVAGRPVRDRLLTRALVSGYGRMLPPGRWPAAIIFVELEPADVDVNVHPAKAEVRFRQPDQVFSLLARAVSRAIGQAPIPDGAFRPADEGRFSPRAETFESSATPFAARWESWNRPGRPGSSDFFQPPSAGGKQAPPSSPPPDGSCSDEQAHIPPWLQDERPETTERRQPPAGQPPPADPQSPAGQEKPAGRPPGEADLNEGVWPLAQLYQSYILAQGPDGLYIIDQHAAHERILYNQLKEKLAAGGLPGQRRLFPDTFELPPHQNLAAERLAPRLTRLGFELEPFGGQTFMLKSAPAILKDHDPWPVLLEILGAAQGRLKALDGAGLEETLENLANSWLYSLACRAAIKAGQKLALEEMAALLSDLVKTQNGGYCPHGRPAVFVVSREYMEKKFNRR